MYIQLEYVHIKRNWDRRQPQRLTSNWSCTYQWYSMDARIGPFQIHDTVYTPQFVHLHKLSLHYVTVPNALLTAIQVTLQSLKRRSVTRSTFWRRRRNRFFFVRILLRTCSMHYSVVNKMIVTTTLQAWSVLLEYLTKHY